MNSISAALTACILTVFVGTHVGSKTLYECKDSKGRKEYKDFPCEQQNRGSSASAGSIPLDINASTPRSGDSSRLATVPPSFPRQPLRLPNSLSNPIFLGATKDAEIEARIDEVEREADLAQFRADLARDEAVERAEELAEEAKLEAEEAQQAAEQRAEEIREEAEERANQLERKNGRSRAQHRTMLYELLFSTLMGVSLYVVIRKKKYSQEKKLNSNEKSGATISITSLLMLFLVFVLSSSGIPDFDLWHNLMGDSFMYLQIWPYIDTKYLVFSCAVLFFYGVLVYLEILPPPKFLRTMIERISLS